MTAQGRIERRFAELRRNRDCGLVAFLTAADPTPAVCAKLLDALVAGGADMIELGMPFSDPMADGPAIQASSLRALKAGGGMNTTLQLAREFRQRHPDTPLILMGYYNPVHKTGAEKFAGRAKDAGADGLIIVDLPPEEEDELRRYTDAAGLSWTRMMTPASDARRRKTLLAKKSAFIYYVAIKGITGTRTANLAELRGELRNLARETELPVAVGFGLRTPADLAEIRDDADAVVVGSALVEEIANAVGDNGGDGDSDNDGDSDALAEKLRGKVSELKAALNKTKETGP